MWAWQRFALIWHHRFASAGHTACSAWPCVCLQPLWHFLFLYLSSCRSCDEFARRCSCGGIPAGRPARRLRRTGAGAVPRAPPPAGRAATCRPRGRLWAGARCSRLCALRLGLQHRCQLGYSSALWLPLSQSPMIPRIAGCVCRLLHQAVVSLHCCAQSVGVTPIECDAQRVRPKSLS